MSQIIAPYSKGDADILIKVMDGDNEYTILMRGRDKMRDLMKRFWKGSAKKPHPALFTFKGKKLRARSTVTSLKLVCGDIIQYSATGKNPKEIYFEDIYTLAVSCKQFSDNLRKIFPYIPWFQSPSGITSEQKFAVNVGNIEGTLWNLARLHHAPYNRESLMALASAECFLATFVMEMFNDDDVLCDTAFFNYDMYQERAVFAKLCLHSALNRESLFKTTTSLSTIPLWPVEVLGLANEDTIMDHMPDATDDAEVCLVCHDCVETPTASNIQASPDLVATPCCHKFAHARCLAEWFVHGVHGDEFYKTGTCPNCRAIYPTDDAYVIYRKALSLIASRGKYTNETGLWASKWCENENRPT